MVFPSVQIENSQIQLDEFSFAQNDSKSSSYNLRVIQQTLIHNPGISIRWLAVIVYTCGAAGKDQCHQCSIEYLFIYLLDRWRCSLLQRANVWFP